MKPIKAFEMLGIVLLRFKLLPRIWASMLILVNAGSLLFIDTIYGQVNLIALLAAVLVMTAIYSRLGFVRLLGIGHIFWLPMLIWFGMNLPDKSQEPWLHWWVTRLIVFNSVSLVIDTIDVLRFIRGERQPSYTWDQS